MSDGAFRELFLVKLPPEFLAEFLSGFKRIVDGAIRKFSLESYRIPSKTLAGNFGLLQAFRVLELPKEFLEVHLEEFSVEIQREFSVEFLQEFPVALLEEFMVTLLEDSPVERFRLAMIFLKKKNRWNS